jgi:hypothetical protein
MGGCSAVMLLKRTIMVMLLNCTGGVVWALKPPEDTPLHPVKVTRRLLYIKLPVYLQYDFYVYLMIFDACISITWANGREWALEISSFLGPKWHSPIGLIPFHRAQKTFDFKGPTPSHLPS